MEITNNLELRANLKSTRKKAGLTQEVAARLVYRHVSTWEKWESGDNNVDLACYELFIIKVNALSINVADTSIANLKEMLKSICKDIK